MKPSISTLKSSLLVLLFLGITSFVYGAPVPTIIPYQAHLTDSSNVAQSGTSTVTIRIYDAPTGGTLLFEEVHPTTSINNGYFSVSIGSIGDVNGGTTASAITDLQFDRSYYLTVEIAAPFSTGEMTTQAGIRSQLGTVPFATIAYGALQASSSTSLTADKGKLFFNTSSNELNLYNGTSWVPVVVQGTSTSFSGLTVTGTSTLATTTATSLTVSATTTTTGLLATLLNAVTAVITNLTATNATATNLVATNSTSTNSFVASLVATLANITNLVVGNSTTTNAVITNAQIANSTTTGSQVVTGTSTLATTTVSTLTVNGPLETRGTVTAYATTSLLAQVTIGTTTGNPTLDSMVYIESTSTKKSLVIGSQSGDSSFFSVDWLGKVKAKVMSIGTGLYADATLASDLNGPTDTFTLGRYTYVANYGDGNVVIVDTLNKDSPTTLATLDTPGSPTSVYVSGSYVYTTNDYTGDVSISDVSNPLSPVVISSVATGDAPNDIQVVGGYAYVANYSDKVFIIDVSSSTDPLVVASSSTGGGDASASVAVEGNNLFVSSINGLVSIFDITTPTAPTLVSTTTTLSAGGSFAVSGNIAVLGGYAYVSSYENSSVSVVDVSNLSAPFVLRTVATGNNPFSVTISGGYLYVSNYTDGTVTVYSLSDPSLPTKIATLTAAAGAHSVEVTDGYLYTANYLANTLSMFNISDIAGPSTTANNLEVSNLTTRNNLFLSSLTTGSVPFIGTNGLVSQNNSNFFWNNASTSLGIGTSSPLASLFVQGKSGSDIFALASSSGETLLSFTQGGSLLIGTTTSTFDSSKLVVQGTTTLVSTTGAPTALRVIGNIDNTASASVSPRVVSTLSSVGTNIYGQFAISGKYAYVPDYDNSVVTVVDTSDPLNPAIVGTVQVGTGPQDVTVSGHYMYVAIYGAASLQIFDISEPVTPVLVGSVVTDADPIVAQVSGSYAYVANESGSMQVIDISNPRSPVVVGQVAGGSHPYSLKVSGKYVYMNNILSDNVQIIDVSDPRNPVTVSTVGTDVQPIEVAVSGRYAYTTNYIASTISVIDLSSSTQPVSVATFPVNASTEGLAVSGRYLFTTSFSTNSMQIIDVASSTAPNMVGEVPINSGGVRSRILVSGRYAYIANGATGTFQIIDLGGLESTSALIHSLEAGNLSVRNDLTTGGILNVGTALTVGSGGFLSQGNSAIYGSLQVGTSTYPNFLVNASNNTTNIGTSTGLASLFVQGTSTLNPFTVASSTGGSLFTINTAGLVTLTSASTTNLTVSDQTYLANASATALTVGTLFSNGVAYTNASTTNQTISNNLYLSGLTTGSIPFIGTNGLVSQNNANFFWDNTNTRLGIGSSSPIATLSVRGVAGANPFVVASSTGATLFSVNQSGLATLSTASTTGAATIGGQLFFASASSTGGLTLAQTLNVTGQTTLTTASATALTVSGQSVFNTSSTTVGTVTTLFSTLATITNASTTNITTSGNLYLSGLTTGSIPFIGTNGLVSQNNANFFWDNTNTRLGIGSSSPIATLSVRGVAGANPFVVASSTGSSLFTVLANGNVGIGTSSPDANLTLSGLGNTSALIEGAGVPSLSFKNGFSGSGIVSLYSDNSLRVGVESATNTSHFVISSSADVGIGTSDPTTQVQAAGSPSFQGLVVNKNFPTLVLKSNNGSTYRTSIYNTYGDTVFSNHYASGNLIFNNAGSEVFRLTSTGNIGIGTTTPDARVSIQGSAGVNPFTVASSSGASLFTILANGNIGVASSTPYAKLDVYNGDQSTGIPSIRSFTPNGTYGHLFEVGNTGLKILSKDNGTLTFGRTASSVGYGRLIGSSAGISFSTSPNDSTYTEYMNLSSSGVLGIGTSAQINASTSPSLLNVLGKIVVGNDNSTNGSVILEGRYGTGGALTVLGTEQSSGGPVLGYAVSPSTTTPGAFLSSYNLTSAARSAITVAEGIKFFVQSATTSPIGTPLSLLEAMKITSDGNIGIASSSPVFKLGVVGTFGVTGQTTLSNASATSLTAATLYSSTLYGATTLLGTTTNTFDTSKLVVQGSTTLIGTAGAPTALKVIGNIDNTFQQGDWPRFITSTTTSAPGDLVVSNGFMYVISGAELSIYNVVDINNPLLISTSSANGNNIEVVGNYVYILGSSFSIVDVTDKRTPVQVGSVSYGSSYGYSVIRGQYAYVSSSVENSLKVIDINDPRQPKVVASLSVGSSPRNLAISGNVLYLVEHGAGGNLYSIDISNPLNPILLDTLGVAGGLEGVQVSNGYVYVQRFTSGGLYIVDASDPSDLSNITSIGTGSGSNDIKISGRYAYVPNYNSDNFSIIDISNPRSPQLVKNVPTSARPIAVYVDSRTLYVSNYNASQVSFYELPGIESVSALIHSLEAGNLSVRNDLSTQGMLTAGTGLTVGSGGFLSQGNSAIYGSFAVGTSTNTLFTVNSSNNTVSVGTSSSLATFFVQGTSTNNPFAVSSSSGDQLLSLTGSGILNLYSVNNTPSLSNIYVNGGNTSTTTTRNIALGYQSFENASATASFYDNIALGYQALRGSSTELMSGGYNIAIGSQSLSSNTSGYSNTAVGVNSLSSNTTGYTNSAFGFSVLNANTVGTNNNGFGYNSLTANTSGISNVAFGSYSLTANTSGSSNTAVGNAALFSSKDGFYNTAFGANALYYASSTSGNIAFGASAGRGDQTIPDERSVFDNYSGFIGYEASRDSRVASTTSLTNAWAIGYKAKVGSSNSIVLGATTTADAVNVGIGTSSPVATLSITGRGGISPLLLASSSGASMLTLLQNGDLALGTSTASSRLDIYQSTAATSTDMFRILSDVGSSGNPVFKIKANGDIFTDGNTTIGTPADLAENYPTLDDSITHGMVVSLSTTTVTWTQSLPSGSTTDYEIATVQKAKVGEVALGIISTRPGILLGGNTEKGIPVAFSGRVPVYVSNENGTVHIGDTLTISSSTPGYAMKQTTSGPTLGRALSNQDESSTSSLVMVIVENKEHTITISGVEGLALLDASSTPTTSVRDSLASRLAQGFSVVKEYVAVEVRGVRGYFDQIFARNIHSDIVESRVICLGEGDNKTCVTKEKLDSLLLLNPNNQSGEGQTEGGSSGGANGLTGDLGGGTVNGTTTEGGSENNGTSTDIGGSSGGTSTENGTPDQNQTPEGGSADVSPENNTPDEVVN